MATVTMPTDDFEYDGAAEIAQAWRDGLKPDPLLTVSQWADEHRMLSSKASAEPGRWRTSRTPYLREIMDALSPSSALERVVFMKGAQVGAPLALDVPIPTPTGWTTMGEVAVGDEVFDEHGQPCPVVGVSPVLHDRPCFEVVFSDHTRIVCDGDHLWTVWDERHPRYIRLRTLPTREIAATVKSRKGKTNRYAIDLTRPLALPAQDLPIHPYLLGLWLGNGNRNMNRICCHEDDAFEIRQHLIDCNVHAEVVRLPSTRGRATEIVIEPGGGTKKCCPHTGRFLPTSGGTRFMQAVHALGLFRNKFIPVAYLRASAEQRMELLRGLMDADGSVTQRGRCEASFVLPSLVVGLRDLLFGLGLKPSLYPAAAKVRAFNGIERSCLPSWRLSFTAYADWPVFKLQRKRARMMARDAGRPSETERRRIVAVHPAPSVPVRCISVQSPNHLFLAGWQMVPTHNTESGSNWLGYIVHHAPGPVMAVWPTVDMAKRNSKQRIDPLIEESPVLAELISPSRSRDSGNTILSKEFRGGVLVMTGANSAVGLRSMPVRYLFLDEVDGYPRDVEGEGDAISLAEARTRTFARRKIFIVSTPTIAGASAIEREYEASDQRRYFVPCPHCGALQWLRFERLRWPKGEPRSAAYHCEACEAPIAEHHKTAMLEAGRWQATALDYQGKTAGFHLSSLYSPVGWRSWADIASAWEAAIAKESGSAAAIKTFKNTELGETWVEEGESPDWQRLLERREDYRVGTIPWGGLLLVAGADVQKDRIECSVWAWGRQQQSWLIEHRVLMGDTSRDAVWKRLAEMSRETWSHASGVQFPLKALALDTGYATQEAYAFVRGAKDARILPVKGMRAGAMGGAALVGIPTSVDVSTGGKKLRRGMRVYSVAVGMAKMELYNHLRLSATLDETTGELIYPPGYVHLPKVDTEYLQQLCAEQLVTRRNRNGFPVREWHKVRERNEALDIFVYCRAAASILGMDRFEERHWRELERTLLGDHQTGADPPEDSSQTRLSIHKATEISNESGGFVVSEPVSSAAANRAVTKRSSRTVLRSRWMTR